MKTYLHPPHDDRAYLLFKLSSSFTTTPFWQNPIFSCQNSTFPDSQFKFTTIGHISLGILLPNKWDCQANSSQAQERRFDSFFSFDCFWCCSSSSSACFFAPEQSSSSVTRMTPFGFIWIPLAVNTFYWCPCNFAVRGTPSPPGVPGETEEEMPTRGDRSTPHHSNWRSHLKACNFFPILWSK